MFLQGGQSWTFYLKMENDKYSQGGIHTQFGNRIADRGQKTFLLQVEEDWTVNTSKRKINISILMQCLSSGMEKQSICRKSAP